jgi:hypothetical protein
MSVSTCPEIICVLGSPDCGKGKSGNKLPFKHMIQLVALLNNEVDLGRVFKKVYVEKVPHRG